MLVLASASPRRHQLLRWLGVEYIVDPPEVEEHREPAETVQRMVTRLARAKAAVVVARRPDAWVLAADTVVEVDGDVLGKPADRREAAAMLARLAGCEHRVFTGFALTRPGGHLSANEVVMTRVRFRGITPASIAAYVATGEPVDKAGAYAIQGFGAGLVEAVEGSFTNVIGLPLVEVNRALEEAGLLAR